MKMRFSPLAVALAALAPSCGHLDARAGALPGVTETSVETTDPETFVCQYYVHSVPYERARKLRPGATEVLTRMADDPRYDPYRANIIVTLGMLADPASTDYLIWVARSGSGPSTPKTYSERTGAIMALGYLVHGSGDARALQFLQARASPKAWNEVRWKSPFARSSAEQAAQLARVSILALALTGRAEAAASLRRVAADEARWGDPTLARAATLALREHAIIARRGLAAYYRHPSAVDTAYPARPADD